MSWDIQRKPGSGNASQGAEVDSDYEEDTPQERARARRVSRALLKAELGNIQRRANGQTPTASPHEAAATGIASPTTALPHAERIQASFGPAHDVSKIRAHVGGDSAASMGATAYATGDHVVFDKEPDLHTAAHEAAHVVQQARGVRLKGWVGRAGDELEQNADAVADRVVAGESATDLLGSLTSSDAPRHAVQRKEKPNTGGHGGAASKTTAHSSGDTDPMIAPASRELHFPKTLVGSSSQGRMVFRNEDSRPIVIDRLATLHPDPFGEFRVVQNSSVVVEPGEQHAFTVEFHPARATRVQQVVEVHTGFGPAGPAADVRLSGEGIDVAYDGERTAEQDGSVVSSAIATEVRIEEQERDLVEMSRAHDELHRQRAEAQHAVHMWRDSAFALNESIAKWTVDNWIDFLGKTGGDHELHGTAQVIDWWKRAVYTGAKKGLAAGADTVVDVAKKSAKIALALEYPLFGPAITQGVERLSDFILDKLGLKPEKPEDESDRHAVDATKSTARASVQKNDEILTYKAGANLAIRDSVSAAELRIAACDSAAELAQWKQWAVSERKKLPPQMNGGFAFSDVLLKQWVLEHAGTTHAANKKTNPKAWGAARDELKKKGLLQSLERSDLFVHQCRHEWGSLGLVGADEAAMQLDAERLHIEASVREHQNSDSTVASQIAQRLSGNLVTFHRTNSPRYMASEFGKQDYQLGPEDKSDVFGLRLFGSEFTLDCRVFLGVEGNGVVAKHFLYDVYSATEDKHPNLWRTPMTP